MHKSITKKRILASVERRATSLDNPGFCLTCGHEQEGCEPDARGYECEACGESGVNGVYGDEELMFQFCF